MLIAQYVYATDDGTVEQITSTEEPVTVETPAAETPAVEPSTEEPASEEPASGETPAEETPAEETPAEETPTEETPAEETPAEETPAEGTPAEETPAEETPAEETPAEETPTEETPAEETPAEETSTEETPTQGDDFSNSIGLDNTILLSDLTVPVNELINELAEDNGVSISHSDVTLTMPSTGTTYTLRISLTRHTVGDESISLVNTEEYQVTQTVGGTTTNRYIALNYDPSYWGVLGGVIYEIPAGATITLEDVLVTLGDGTTWGDYLATYLQLELINDDNQSYVSLKEHSQSLTGGDITAFEVDDALSQNLTTDTFTSLDWEYSLLYLLNNYNVVSYEDIEATHIVGPIIAQEGAYRTGDTYAGANHDGSDLVASDYSRGVSSYVGTLYTLENDLYSSALQLGYGFDDDDPDFVPPDFYTRATEFSNGDESISIYAVGDYQYVHLERSGGTFLSPNAHGLFQYYADNLIDVEATAQTYQNDNFIDFDDLWDAITEDSYNLMENGILEGVTEVITIYDAGTSLTLEAGKSYLIKDATYLESVNIILPDDYSFFVNPYLPPTTISFEGTTINPAIYDGLLVSQFPETLINDVNLSTEMGYGGEYSEVGNKIIWNLPNVVTTGNENRLVTFGEGVNIAGHIVAVNAEFWNINADGSWEGGNLNGTAIVKDFHSGNMEMHMWAYGGLLEQGTYVQLEVLKTFTDGDFSQHEFQFTLVAANESTLEEFPTTLTATTGDSGSVYFSSLVFDTADTYTFNVSEVIPSEAGTITYDKSKYQVVVQVTKSTGEDSSGYTYINYSNTVTYTKIVDSDGNETSTSATALTFTNTQNELDAGDTVSYTFTKVDEYGYTLSGATFLMLTTMNPATDSDAWNTNEVISQTSGSGGSVTFDQLSPNTVYYFKESAAPSGYDLPTGYWMLTVDEYGNITVVSVGGAPTIVNHQLVNYRTASDLAYVTLTKENQHGSGLEGAVFLVTRVVRVDDAYITVEGGYSAQVTSGENGTIQLTDLPLDQIYRIDELEAPEGYMLPYNVSYWLLEITSDDSSLGYSVTLYAVDDDVENPLTVTPDKNGQLVIINWDVYILPTTGGLGNLIYYTTGLALCGVGLWYNFNIKRRKEEN